MLLAVTLAHKARKNLILVNYWMATSVISAKVVLMSNHPHGPQLMKLGGKRNVPDGNPPMQSHIGLCRL